MTTSLKINYFQFFIILCLFLIPTVALAATFEFVQQDNYNYYDEAGFFSGIWHGLIAPYSLIARWFSGSIEMYAFSNTGWFYDAGFLVGVAGSLPIGWLAAIIASTAMFV
jgi:hypothetical protein